MGTRPRVLLAPVTITPTKPLTPSHLKGLLWTDVMFRATAHLADVTYRYSHTTYFPTEQTLGFWEYLDRTVGELDYQTLGEEDIGELYVRFRADQQPASAEALRSYADAVENDAWVHPAGARMLRIQAEHYARLGLHDPGLEAHQPPGLLLEETIERLVGSGCGLDQRAYGGPVYLDATRHGMPLRQIVGADGRPNYLACALRELLALVPDHDEVVLLYDSGLDPDYRLLQRALSGYGATVRRVPIGRVPIDGRIVSARHGGWRDYTVEALLRRVAADDVTVEEQPAVVRLGMRLYFIATLGPGEHEPFRADLLSQCMGRARRMLARAGETPPDHAGEFPRVLERHRRDHTYVDPYRLTSSLLGRHRPTPDPELLSEVFL